MIPAEKNTFTTIFSTRISDALNTAKVCHTITFIPPKRATHSFLLSSFDGEIGRPIFYGNLLMDKGVMVPTPVLRYSGFLLTHIDSQKDISEFNGQLGYVRGISWMESLLSKYNDMNAISISTVDLMVKMFKARRLDGILISTNFLKKYPELRHDYPSSKVMNLTDHIWLNVNKKHLVPIIDSALQNYLKNNHTFLRDNQTSN